MPQQMDYLQGFLLLVWNEWQEFLGCNGKVTHYRSWGGIAVYSSNLDKCKTRVDCACSRNGMDGVGWGRVGRGGVGFVV